MACFTTLGSIGGGATRGLNMSSRAAAQPCRSAYVDALGGVRGPEHVLPGGRIEFRILAHAWRLRRGWGTGTNSYNGAETTGGHVTIEDRSTEIAGNRIVEFDPASSLPPGTTAVRVGIDWEQHDAGQTFSDVFATLRDDPAAATLEGLVIGDWGGAGEGEACDAVVEALVASRARFPGLRALFIGDMTSEECEVSWIELADMSPLWQAYPTLEYFRSRGMTNLSLGDLSLEHLTHLIVETGGLPGNVLAEVCRARLPRLVHLELWLGDDGYGWESSVADLGPILAGDLFPSLKSLGLRNSCVADDVAHAVSGAPILERVDELDLSLGTLSDEGARALASSPLVAKLRKLDIHHHFVSEDVVEMLRATGVVVNADDRQEPDEYGGETYRYVAVSE